MRTDHANLKFPIGPFVKMTSFGLCEINKSKDKKFNLYFELLFQRKMD